MQQLVQFLNRTVRRLRSLGKVIVHSSARENLAIKIPFFVEIGHPSKPTGIGDNDKTIGPHRAAPFSCSSN